MQGQPKLPDVAEVLDRLDQNWQELVMLLKKEQLKSSRPMVEPQGVIRGRAGDDLEGAGSPRPPFDRGNRQVSPILTEALQPEEPEEEKFFCSPASEAPAEKLPRQGRGQNLFKVTSLVLLAVTLGGLTFLLAQNHMGRSQLETGMLTITGKDGARRAWLGEHDDQVSLCLLDKAGKPKVELSLDAAGRPSLWLIDEPHRNRVELKMEPGGEPIPRQVKEPDSSASEAKAPAAPAANETANPAPTPAPVQTPAPALPETAAPKPPEDVSALPQKAPADEPQQDQGELKIGPGGEPIPRQIKEPDSSASEAKAPAAPAANETATPAPTPAPALPETAAPKPLEDVSVLPQKAPAGVPAVKFVGSKTSNKYHYPECRWAKAIRPQKLVPFTSVEEAQVKGYIPCPVCKPPEED